tara:strand:+ start:1238 stop:1423 length:186 start_codon:yes stop_codon:yes gene_type:complete
MRDMEIKDAKYNVDLQGNNTSVSAIIDGVYLVVPLNAYGNIHTEEIMKQLKEGTLTIKDAE